MTYREITSDLIEALKNQRILLKDISAASGFRVPELCLIAQSLALPRRKRGRKKGISPRKVQQELAQ